MGRLSLALSLTILVSFALGNWQGAQFNSVQFAPDIRSGSTSIWLWAAVSAGIGALSMRWATRHVIGGVQALLVGGLVAVLGFAVPLRMQIRSLQQAQRLDDALIEQSARVGASPTVRLIVRESTIPGPTCRFLAQIDGFAARVLVDSDLDICELSDGDHLLVGRDALHRALDIPPLDPLLDPQEGAILRRHGALRRLRLHGLALVRRSRPGYWAFVARMRWRAFVKSVGRPDRGFVVATSIGLASALPFELQAMLQIAGLNHLVAVSGQQVGFAAGWFQFLAVRLLLVCGQRPRLAAILASIPLWVYVGLTGATPSAMRAGVMAQIGCIGAALGRPAHGPLTLFWAAAAMVLIDPDVVGDVGFQLSAAAMFAVFSLPADAGVVEQTWRMTWVLAPICLWHFGECAIGGILANIIAVPIFGLWMLPAGLVGWSCESWLGDWVLAPADWSAQLILIVGEWIAKAGKARQWHWGALAGISLLLHVMLYVYARYARDSGMIAYHVARWLPARGLAIAVAVVVSWRALAADKPVASNSASYFIVAQGNRASWLGPLPSNAARRVLVNPRGSPARWRAWLLELKLGPVDVIVSDLEETSLVAWQQVLAESGLLTESNVAGDVHKRALTSSPDFSAAIARCQQLTGLQKIYLNGELSALKCWHQRSWKLLSPSSARAGDQGGQHD